MNIEVPIGKVEVTSGKDDVLLAGAVGSCVIITFYDAKLRAGGMAHAMLPRRVPSSVSRGPSHESRVTSHESDDAMYVDKAIEVLLKKMQDLGAKKEDIHAKLIGGANMFMHISPDIGTENAANVRKELKKKGIFLAGECAGGSLGRSVEFSIDTGTVTVRTIF